MIKEKYTTKVKQTSINIVQTRMESIRKKDITRTGLRIYDNGLIGVSGAIGEYDETDLEKRAMEALKQEIPYPYEVSGNFQETLDSSEELIDDENLVPEVEELLAEISQSQPAFSFSNKIKMTEELIKLENDVGLELEHRDRYLDVELAFKEKTSTNIIDGFTGFKGRDYDRVKVLEMINEVCEAFKNQIEFPKAGKYPVMFLSDYMLPLIKFIHDLNGLTFGSRSSLFSDKVGRKVFNEKLSLYQNLDPVDTFDPFFDAEGVVNDNYVYPLIEEGVIKTGYTDKRTAAMFNLPLTGSALSSYDGVPTLGFKSFKLMESSSTLKELLGGEKGIFVIMAAGGDFTPEGNFASPVQLGMFTDGEKLLGRLPDIQISSKIFKMFGKRFRGVSKDKVFPLSQSKALVLELDVSKI